MLKRYRGLLGATAGFLALAGVLWFAVRPLAVGMIIGAPSPGYEPGVLPRGADAAIEIERAGARVRAWVFNPQGAPRATVFLLHGIGDSKESLVSSAVRLERRGYRAVTVDSRGHGESSGRFLTYGVEESRDLRDLVDELRRHSLLVEPVAVIGTSYGAATAIEFAAIDPRVRAVVAVSPFASLREIVPEYVTWMGGPAALVIPESVINHVIDEAGRTGGFDPEQACARCAARHLRVPMLVIHSRDDERIPWEHSDGIARACATPVDLHLIDGASHNETGSAYGVEAMLDRWLDAHLPAHPIP